MHRIKKNPIINEEYKIHSLGFMIVLISATWLPTVFLSCGSGSVLIHGIQILILFTAESWNRILIRILIQILIRILIKAESRSKDNADKIHFYYI